MAARRLLYPLIFQVPEQALKYESMTRWANERQRIFDGEMAIDRLVKVSAPRLAEPLTFTIQERFRNRYGTDWHGDIVDYTKKYTDVTITEWNHASNLPSELFKIRAGYFIYAYYDPAIDTFFKPIMVNVPKLLLTIVHDEIPWDRDYNPKQQSFLGFPYDELKSLGLDDFYKDEVSLSDYTPFDVVTELVTTPRLM